MLNIINVPDKILRQKSKPITKVDKKILKFTSELTETLLKKSDPPGVGLSGIQVGKPWRVFITYLPKDRSISLNKWSQKNQELSVYINPEIIDVSDKKTLGGKKSKPMLEGCLSIPNIYGSVWRYDWIKIRYTNLIPTSEVGKNDTSEVPDHQTGGDHSPPQSVLSVGNNNYSQNVVTKKFKGFAARVVQHEYDHLEGILFTDYSMKESLPIYFDDGDEMVEVQNPKTLVKW